MSVLALGSLAGCPVPVTQVNHLPASAPLAQPRPIPSDGDFSHTPSGYAFPLRVASFQRGQLLQYDSAALDVSAGYEAMLARCRVILTIYVYPTPHMTFVGANPDVVRSIESRWLDAAYTEAKAAIVGNHSDAVLQSEAATTRDGVTGKQAVYAIGAVQSELELFVVHHEWFLKDRASYPDACAEDARQALAAFFAAWPGHAG